MKKILLITCLLLTCSLANAKHHSGDHKCKVTSKCYQGHRGHRGHTGAQGIQGIQGIQGAQGPQGVLNFGGAELIAEGIKVAKNANIKFLTTSSISPSAITYNPSTGAFTLTQPGIYQVSYKVHSSTTTGANSVVLAFTLGGDLFQIETTKSATITTEGNGIMSGTFLIEVTPADVNGTLSLINSGTDDLTLDSAAGASNIVITQLSSTVAS